MPSQEPSSAKCDSPGPPGRRPCRNRRHVRSAAREPLGRQPLGLTPAAKCMAGKEDRRLRVGVLGCGPIAQFAHLEACVKARNAELYAICDAAARSARAHGRRPTSRGRIYADYDAMLADPEVEAVIVATSDAFHVPASIRALEAGKHVLCEKPIGVSVEEGEELAAAVAALGPAAAGRPHEAVRPGAGGGPRLRPRRDRRRCWRSRPGTATRPTATPMTDAVQPLPVTSRLAPEAGRRPEGGPRALLHARARLAPRRHRALPLRRDRRGAARGSTERFGAYCWFVDTEFASGALGPSRPDGGGADGLARGLPALRRERLGPREDLQPLVLPVERGRDLPRARRDDRASRSAPTATSSAASSRGSPMPCSTARRCAAPTSRTGIASIRAMVAIARSAETGARVRARRRRRGGLMRLGIFAKTFPGDRARGGARRGPRRRLCDDPVQPRLRRAARRCRRRCRPRRWPRIRAGGGGDAASTLAALSGTYNMAHPDPGVRADGGCAGSRVVIEAAAALGIPLVTLCTGTRDPDDQWRHHPGNAERSAWRDMAAEVGEGAGRSPSATASISASSPSTANIVTSRGRRPAADRRDRLAAAVASCSTRPISSSAPTAAEARAIVAARRRAPPPAISPWRMPRTAMPRAASPPPGRASSTFRDFVARAAAAGFDGPLVTHGLSADEAPAVARDSRGARLMPRTGFAAPRRRRLAVVRRGRRGPAVVFQHGLGGDAAQAGGGVSRRRRRGGA